MNREELINNKVFTKDIISSDSYAMRLTISNQMSDDMWWDTLWYTMTTINDRVRDTYGTKVLEEADERIYND